MNRGLLKAALPLALSAGFCYGVAWAETAPSGGAPCRITADVTEGYYDDGQPVLHGTGNVRVLHGDFTITANEGWLYENDRLVVLKGDVHVVNRADGTELFGEYGEYYERDRRAVVSDEPIITGPTKPPGPAERGESPALEEKTEGAPEDERYHVKADVTEGYIAGEEQVLHGIGNVVITHGDTTITCDEAWSYKKEDNAVLKGNVRLVNKKENYVLTSQYGEYFGKTKLAVASKGPKLVLGGDRPVTITGDIMQMNTETEEGEVTGSAHVVSGDVEAFGETLLYFGQDGRVELLGTPVAWQGDSRLAGDKITLFFEGDEVERLLVEGVARVIYFAAAREEEPETAEEGSSAEPEAAEADEAPGTTFERAVSAAADLPEGVTGAGTAVGEAPAYKLALGADSGGSPAPAAAEETDEEKPPAGRVEASGDTIDCLFADGKIERIYIIGSAESSYMPFDELGRETGERIDTEGDRMTVHTDGEEVKKIIIEGTAVGVYYPADAVGRAGVTRTEGDRISVYLLKSEVRRVVVFGHARGSYFTKEASAEAEGKTAGGPGS